MDSLVPPSMSERRPTIAYITAGAGGMYCGSCLHDNTLAAALGRLGVDIQLIPTYTPIRTDETDVSIDRVFLGGINVYLQQKSPVFRHLPAWLDRALAHPSLIRHVAARHVRTDASRLGELTVSMLRGSGGNQRKEIERLCRWLNESVHPQLVNLSNILIAGCAPRVKAILQVPLLVTLQGDDVFLDDLPEPHRSLAVTEIRNLIGSIDGFLVHSTYYADHMSEYLGIPRDRFHQVKLGIAADDFRSMNNTEQSSHAVDKAGDSRPPTIGYLARLAPEKGLHVLCEALIELRQRAATSDARLRIAGWLGPSHRDYVLRTFKRLDEAGCSGAYQYEGEVDRLGKVRFLRSLDVLSVPTVYREPKGLYVLEALAAGVPVVQPRHGAFPEILAATGGGRLFAPGDSRELADVLYQVLIDHEARRAMSQNGLRAVHEQFNAEAMAHSTWEIFRKFLHPATVCRAT